MAEVGGKNFRKAPNGTKTGKQLISVKIPGDVMAARRFRLEQALLAARAKAGKGRTDEE